MKRILTIENNYERMDQARTLNLQENIYDCREALLRSSNVEKDDEKHRQDFLRHSGMIKRVKVEQKMKII